MANPESFETANKPCPLEPHFTYLLKIGENLVGEITKEHLPKQVDPCQFLGLVLSILAGKVQELGEIAPDSRI